MESGCRMCHVAATRKKWKSCWPSFNRTIGHSESNPNLAPSTGPRMSANPQQWAHLRQLASLGSRYEFPRWLPDQPEDFLESSCHFLVDNWNYKQFSQSKTSRKSICAGWFSWFSRTVERNPEQFRSDTFNVPIALILSEG